MSFNHIARLALGAGATAALWVTPHSAMAETPQAVIWILGYKADVSGTLSGAENQAGRFLDNIDATADVSLERLWGWSGAHVYAHLLSNSGGAPNDVAETLQGVDNIEVARPRAKLYQFWVEQSFADDRFSVLAGLYDLNSEFYQTEAAGLLIAPAFGIGSELAATGPNGPSIFPSTALALRARWATSAHQKLQIAVLDAAAGVLGDPGGVDTSFDDGALVIVEWTRNGAVQMRVGAWRYTDRQDDIRDVNAFGAPIRRHAQGMYVSIEGPLVHSAGRETTGFLRIGAADGDTTVYRGGWQAGVNVAPAFVSRPESAFSIGVDQGLIDPKQRANMGDLGQSPAHAELALEITYADQLIRHVTLQPDLQFIHDPAADRDRNDVVVGTLRVAIEL